MEPKRRRFEGLNSKERWALEAAEGGNVNRIFVSDCEGPISKNDNAYELAAHFVPNGDRIFSLVSKYDDILADVLKREDYNAGDTLKLILPFLKAYGVTDAKIQKFSAQNLLLIAGTRETLKHISSVAPAYIVSTSYEHYIKALCNFVGFSFENTYCTRLKIDKYNLTPHERTKLKAIAQEIAAMSMITIPAVARSEEDFSPRNQVTLKRLDEIFWREIAQMSCAKMFYEVTTVGGEQKANAIRDIVTKLETPLSSVMYVGDSITDVQAFQLLRGGGGLSLSFNGNAYAIKNAEVSAMSENNVVTAVLADVFLKHGKQAALDVAGNWNIPALSASLVDSAVVRRLLALYPKRLPKVQIVTMANMDSLVKESSEFRKQVRGEAVGKLG